MGCNNSGFSPAQILDRFYQAFIDVKSPVDFFVGMVDYFQFADSVPTFERVSARLLEIPKPLRERFIALEPKALSDISKRKKELFTYVSKNKIEDARIRNDFEEYEGWESGGTTGFPPKPISMMLRLEDVVFTLFNNPDHKTFASKYLVFSHNNPNASAVYREPESYKEYRDLYNELDRGDTNELWGQLEHLSWLYDVVKRGRKHHKELKEKAEKGDKEAAAEALNYGWLVWEWDQLEQHKKWHTSGREPSFFKVEKVRPWLVRLHLQFMASSVQQEESSVDSRPVKASTPIRSATTEKKAPEIEPSVEGLRFYPGFGDPVDITQQEKSLLQLMLGKPKTTTLRAIEYGLVGRDVLDREFSGKKAFEGVRSRLLEKNPRGKFKVFDIIKGYEQRRKRTKTSGYKLVVYFPQKMRDSE